MHECSPEQHRSGGPLFVARGDGGDRDAAPHMELPSLCVVAYWGLLTHVAYLVHVAATEWYSDTSRCVLSYFHVRYDFTSIHPLLLEWVHTWETACVLALGAYGCGRRVEAAAACGVVAAAGFCGCCRVACRDAPSAVFGRGARVATACAAALAVVPPLLAPEAARAALLAAHAHAAVVPSATVARLVYVDGAGRGALALLALHAAALALGDAALRRPDPTKWACASAAVVVCAREAALACDRRWPRTRAAVIRGIAATHALADLYPPTPFEALLPQRTTDFPPFDDDGTCDVEADEAKVALV